MNKTIAVVVFLFLSSTILYADVAVTDRSTVIRSLTDQSALQPKATDAASDKEARHAAAVAENQAKKAAKLAKRLHGLTPKTTDAASDKAARHAAAVAQNQAKKAAKLAKRHRGLTPVTQAFHPRATATGSISLIDASGLQYFINTNITFSTTSSASAAASEASFTHAVVATTSAGGTTTSTLNDAFDGYQTICVSLTNATGPCRTGDVNYAFFNQTGLPAAFDTTVPAGPNCTNRQVAFPTKTIGALSVTRKVYVPPNDTYARWMNYFTNTSGSPVTFTMITGNNLGSDSNTRIVSTSSGDNVATTADTWVSSFQNYSGNTSSDPRIGHVLWGPGAATPISNINFVDGDDNPFWVYSITLAPGQTKAILNFATGQPSKAAASAKAAALDLLPATATQCLSPTVSQIVNFSVSTDLSIVKSTAAPVAFGGNPITYSIAVSNNGPSSANTVSVSDVLPAGATFVSASGTGWACSNVAGTVTCTVASLPVGAAPVISLTFNAPPVAVAGTLTNTATVSSATTDTNPANNSSTSTVPILPGNQIPALSTWMLGLLAAALGLVALARRT